MELHFCSWNCMQAHWNACNLMDLHATLGNLGQPKECTQTEFNCITLLFHGFDLLTVNILVHSGTFWNILEHSGTFWNILHAFWNILEHSACILEHSTCILEHSACILVHSRPIDHTRTDGQTDRQTDIRTCWAASSQLKRFKYQFLPFEGYQDIGPQPPTPLCPSQPP